MAKKSEANSSERKLQRKLKKLKLKLEVAQMRLQQDRQRGKQEIERARLQAAEWEAEALERVEHRANRVTALEARLVENGAHPSSPSDVADVLESIQTTN